MSISIEEAISSLSANQFESPEEVRKIIASMKGIQLLPSLILNKDQTIYRARVVNSASDIVDSKSLSYLPSQLNNSFRRASTPTNTMFYGISSDHLWSGIYGCCVETCTCFRKPVKEAVRYKVAISYWKTIKELKFVQIFDQNGDNKTHAFSNNKEFKNIANIIDNRNHSSITSLLTYLNKEFTKIVEDNNEREYWVSSIMAEELLNTRKFDGIIYESVQVRDPKVNDVHCLAILPKVVDDFMIFEKAELHEIEFRNYNNEASVILSSKIL